MRDKDFIKGLRIKLDEVIQYLDKRRVGEQPTPDWMAYLMLAMRKTQEAKMWLGKVLEAEGHKLPEEFRDESDMREDIDYKSAFEVATKFIEDKGLFEEYRKLR